MLLSVILARTNEQIIRNSEYGFDAEMIKITRLKVKYLQSYLWLTIQDTSPDDSFFFVTFSKYTA